MDKLQHKKKRLTLLLVYFFEKIKQLTVNLKEMIHYWFYFLFKMLPNCIPQVQLYCCREVGHHSICQIREKKKSVRKAFLTSFFTLITLIVTGSHSLLLGCLLKTKTRYILCITVQCIKKERSSVVNVVCCI